MLQVFRLNAFHLAAKPSAYSFSIDANLLRDPPLLQATIAKSISEKRRIQEFSVGHVTPVSLLFKRQKDKN